MLYSLETFDGLKLSILLFLQIFKFPLPSPSSIFDFLDIYLLIIGYLLLFFSFSTVMFGLKIKFANNWRYFSFILGQIYGFTLFFLSMSIYQPRKYTGPNLILLIIDIFPVSVILIIAGSLNLFWGLKEEWDEIWKVMSINSSVVMSIILLLLGFVIFENSYSKLALFSSPSTPNIYIGMFLILSGIFVNLGISGILILSFGLKLRKINIIILFTSITAANSFLLFGISTVVLDFISINAYNLLHSPISSIYLIISIVFSGISSCFLILMNEEIFQIAYLVQPLSNDDPLKKLNEISKDELDALEVIDIFTIGDLASEEDQEGISKITKIKLDRIKLLIDLANKSLSKKKKQ